MNKICTVCRKSITPDNWVSQDLCKICYLLLKGGNRKCNICNEIKDVIYFERAFLNTCFQCEDNLLLGPYTIYYKCKRCRNRDNKESIKYRCRKKTVFFYIT